MDWLNELWVQIPAGVLLISAAIAFAYRTFPTVYDAMKAAVRLGEIHATVSESLPILKELNANFQPNHGLSVLDRVEGIERDVKDLNESVADIRSIIMACPTVQRKPGGQRATDA